MDKLTREELFGLLSPEEPRRKSAAKQYQNGLGEEAASGPEPTDSVSEYIDSETFSLPATNIFKQPPTTVVSPAPAAPAWQSEQAHLHHILAHSVPRVWNYALRKNAEKDTRALRKKLRELLVWLFEKEGFKTQPHASAPYLVSGRQVAGRIDLLVLNAADKPLLAIEADWAKDVTSVLKLKKLAESSVIAAWIIGTPTDEKSLMHWRKFADDVVQAQSRSWLKVMALQSGNFG